MSVQGINSIPNIIGPGESTSYKHALNSEESNEYQRNYSNYAQSAPSIIEQPYCNLSTYEISVASSINNQIEVTKSSDPSILYLLQESDCDEELAIKALYESNGDIINALDLIRHKMIEMEVDTSSNNNYDNKTNDAEKGELVTCEERLAQINKDTKDLLYILS